MRSLFNIDHDAPCLPTKFCITVIFSNFFFLGITVVPREIEDNGYAKFWGRGKLGSMVYVKMVNSLK